MKILKVVIMDSSFGDCVVKDGALGGNVEYDGVDGDANSQHIASSSPHHIDIYILVLRQLIVNVQGWHYQVADRVVKRQRPPDAPRRPGVTCSEESGCVVGRVTDLWW